MGISGKSVLEKLLHVGAPSPLPPPRSVAGGAGVACSIGVNDVTFEDFHFWDLPFAANGINYTSSQGRDVLSGNFTGCLMASYKVGGEVRVCHVSTGPGQDCLPAWAALKATAANIFEMRPSDQMNCGGAALAYCYGLITSKYEFYAITVVQGAGGAGVKIAAVEKARLLR